jgi:hypothetical protein
VILPHTTSRVSAPPPPPPPEEAGRRGTLNDLGVNLGCGAALSEIVLMRALTLEPAAVVLTLELGAGELGTDTLAFATCVSDGDGDGDRPENCAGAVAGTG